MSNAGAVDPRLAVALAVALAAAAALALLRPWSPGAGGSPGVAPERAPAQPTDAPLAEPELVAEGPIQAIDLEYKHYPRGFDGRATLTGIVEVVDGLPFPQRWRLVIEPSRIGVGSERAEHREREFDGSFRDFREEDLAMGGYRVHVQAPGYYCRAQEVLLFHVAGRPDLAVDHAHLILHLRRAGFVDGAVRDEAGAPVEGLAVTLEARDRTRWATTTAPDGVWRIDGLPEGVFRLALGDLTRPLSPVEEITLAGPQLRVPEQVVPVTATVRFVCVDTLRLPVPGTTLRGFGRPRGAVDAETDGQGEALVRFLPGGEYKVRAEHPSGLSGRVDFSLEGREVEERVEIILRETR